MLLMAVGGLLVVLVCVDMGIKQYIEENFEEEEERETILDKVVLRKVYNKGFCFNTLDKKPELVRKTLSCVPGLQFMMHGSFSKKENGSENSAWYF